VKFSATDVDGAYRIDVDRIEDERGFFGRIWDEHEFAALGMRIPWRQANVGFSHRNGTLRGMHYQRAPAAEWKLVRCTRGAIYDVALDLRAASKTYLRWTGVELSAEEGRMLLIPEGCAHGYLTLRDATEIIYLTSATYEPNLATGVRWDDPAFGIELPIKPEVVSAQDNDWPSWDPGGREGGAQ
jgi:dTDP-4-dehydrorhamnose 3,5-epimerase